MKRVLVFGTFDILHPGHIYFLQQARRLGDFLIVSLARRENVQRIKGRAPVHSEKERAGLVRALAMVDQVVIGAKTDYIGHILSQKPDIIALGYDQHYYAQDLADRLNARGRSVKVVRLRAYKPGHLKSFRILGII